MNILYNEVEVKMIVLQDLKCVKNIDIDKYIEYRESVKANMDNPDWLGDLSKDSLMNILQNDGEIWIYYQGNEWICSCMALPMDNNTLREYKLELDYREVIDYGPMFVNPKYIGNNLQLQMLNALDNYAKSKGYKYAIGTINPFNKYSSNNVIKDGFEYISTIELKRGTRDIYLKRITI